MDLLTIFFISIIPGQISLIILLNRYNRLSAIMKKDSKKYAYFTSIIDCYRMIKTVRNSKNINVSDKSFLISSITLFLITQITIVIWVLIFIFLLDSLSF